MEENKIHNADCLEFMKAMPDNSVDMVLTDPPYGDGTGYGRMDKTIENNEDESINYRVLPELYRILKEDGVCYLFTNWKFAGKIQAFVERETKFTVRTMLVIVKNNFGMGYGFRNQHEICWVLEKGKVRYNGADFSNVQRMDHILHDKDTHPHQKGLDLIGRMIKHATGEGDLVFDPFMGSGTTAVACTMCDRRFIGCEIDPEYHAIAAGRLNQATSTLF